MEVSRLYHQKQMDRAYLQYIKLHHIDVLIQWAYEVLQRSGTLRKENPNSCKVNKPEMRFFVFFLLCLFKNSNSYQGKILRW